MILKIAGVAKEIEWHYIDGIKKIDVSANLKQKLSHFVKEVRKSTDILVVSPFKMIEECIPEEDEDICYRFADCIGNDGAEFCIFFDQTAFLLNDGGDTIDRYFVYLENKE